MPHSRVSTLEKEDENVARIGDGDLTAEAEAHLHKTARVVERQAFARA
jgi:hypothetical protein